MFQSEMQRRRGNDKERFVRDENSSSLRRRWLIEVTFNEAFYGTRWRKMNDCGTLHEKRNTSGRPAVVTGGNEDQAKFSMR